MADDNAEQNNGNQGSEGPVAPEISAAPAAPAATGDVAREVPPKAAKKAPAKKAAAKKAAASGDEPAPETGEAPAEKPAKKAAKRAPAKKTAPKAAKKTSAKASDEAPPSTSASEAPIEGNDAPAAPMPLFQTPETTPAPRKRRAPAKKAAPAASDEALPESGADGADGGAGGGDGEKPAPAKKAARKRTAAPKAPKTAASDEAERSAAEEKAETSEEQSDGESKPGRGSGKDSRNDSDADDRSPASPDSDDSDDSDDDNAEGDGPRRRRRRGGRRRRKSGGGDGGNGGNGGGQGESGDGNQGNQGNQGGSNQAGGQKSQNQGGAKDEDDADSGDGSSRRRRRRRREGDDGASGGSGGDDPNNTTTRVRRARSPEDEITAVSGSTRLEAKKQRRREGREAGRRRAPIVSEAEFLARRESVERVMTIRQRKDLTQIGVLEDKVLVEHYVARESQTSLIGNIYLGRVQNVLPSMEAAFIDIGKGRNAVLYAGEVNWSALGHKDGAPRKIESVLSSGQTILVQVSKDPIGHKGARLTSQISLAGRFLVYVPDGTTSGISRKLPDTERHRLKTLLKEVVPSSAGVIVRTAAEGASEEELTQDVERLKARWEEIEAKTGKGSKGGAPQLLYGEPDLTLKVVRDLFTEDFAKLVISGDEVWETISGYVADIAPDLAPRLEKYDVADHGGADLFTTYRVDEQIAKALDRKVYLPSGGSLVIDRTEAMTVVDVNTGKFTGSGGNLEETVTKNNLEAAEEVVRQLRLRDIGGIIVVDFIDMVLESNRDLVLRRMVECLGRDRTRHQVAEVTSLGLIQMTRKRIGTGLLESFSENCQHCQGRGVVVHDMPIEARQGGDDDSRRGGGGGGGRRRGGRGRGQDDSDQQGSGQQKSGDAGSSGDSGSPASKPSPAEFAAMAKAERAREEQAPAADDAAAAAPVAPQQDETSPTSEPAEPAAPRVVTRTRRGASRTAPVSATPEPSEPSEPAGPAEAAPAVTEPEAVAEPETPAETPAQSPATSHPAEPAAPQVVTRTRRGVSRTVASAPPEPVEAVTAPANPVPAAPAPEASTPEPPRVVTRTRGQGARRAAATSASSPADAPGTEAVEQAAVPTMDEAAPASGQIGSPPESGVVEPSLVDVEPGEPVTAAEGDDPEAEPTNDAAGHVPVKRKGSARKR